ncbi:MAG: asparaginase [Clostridia bacterium]|nr:asparaginase [Clostridia bacterium]
MRDLSNKKVLIINTGGTIGMKNTREGYAPVSGYLFGELKKIDDLNREGMPKWDFVEISPLLDSSNISAPQWNNMAKIIADSYCDYDGFVILHGTDTMAYTASALSFILHGLDKPVVLTGSQIPLCDVRSDARDNLISSVIIAGDSIVKEVCLCFGGKLLRGNRSTKTSADTLVAFDSPNYPHLAEIGIAVKYNHSALSKQNGSSLEYLPFSAVPIGVLKIFPGMQFGLFEDIITDKLSAVVLETFGAGNIPHSGDDLLPIIKKAFKAGAVVVVCSQCVAGSVTLGAYQTSTALKNAGAVSGKDMTTESAVAKLYHLFSMGYTTDKIKSLMEQDLAGELTY